MISPGLAHWLIVAASIALMLIRPGNIPEVYWIGAGVLLILLLRLLSIQLAARAAAKSLDVCLFLIGMMLLSELAREHGVFDWIPPLPFAAPTARVQNSLLWSIRSERSSLSSCPTMQPRWS